MNSASRKVSLVFRSLLALVFVLLLAACATAPSTPDAGSGSGSAGSAEAGGAEAGGSDAGSAEGALVLDGLAVSRDTSFGGVYLAPTIDDFNEAGFAFGDSVDVLFSNGYELRDLPYFNGYYVRRGSPLLVGYPGYPHVEVVINYGDPIWDVAGLSETDTARIVLAEKGKYLATQEAFDITYTNDRDDYPSDEVFANFRALSGGSMGQGTWYRSASPVDNAYKRAPYVCALVKDAGIGYILDLSDNPDEVAEYEEECRVEGVNIEVFTQLYEEGKVGTLDLSASYPSQSFKETLAAGLVELTQHEGPYLVHCIEGKDRTGFVCMLLEALAGASYDEIAADYMTTFDNYYRITREKDPEKYEAIITLNLHAMLEYIAGVEEGADLTTIDFSGPAAQYLRDGGMTDEQIEALVATL